MVSVVVPAQSELTEYSSQRGREERGVVVNRLVDLLNFNQGIQDSFLQTYNTA
jgi:hypothetical protein